MKSRFWSLLGALIACGTLGLAPYAPAPHVWEKLRWLLGGAQDMEIMDVFDLLMHGAPWIWLAVALIRLRRVETT